MAPDDFERAMDGRVIGKAAWMTPECRALEDELRSRLSGRRLVFELGVDEALLQRLIEAMLDLRLTGLAGNPQKLSLFAPAITASYLVAEGIFHFQSGNFWGNLRAPGDQFVLRPAFERSIRSLKLETFEQLVEEGAHRFIAPILAHGGIPKYSLPDFFRVILDELRRGAGDAPDVLARWRATPSRFVGADKPVERFLLHGGPVAADLLERCIDMVRESAPGEVPDADRFGLPAYVCEAYASCDETVRRTTSAGLRAAAPRPFVLIDAYSAVGPLLFLPSAREYSDGYWIVGAGEGAVRYRASMEERLVPLPPAVNWSAELFDAQGVCVRVFPFAGNGASGCLAFDMADGRLVADLGRLRHSRIWLLTPADTAITAHSGPDAEALTPTETAPIPAGAWSGYTLAGYDLHGVTRLVLGEPGGAGERPLWIRIRSTEIALEGTPLDGVASSSGLPVYADVPSLRLPLDMIRQFPSRWSLRVDRAGSSATFDGADLISTYGNVLGQALGDGYTGEVRMYLKGPVGSDLRASFILVPGLRVERPTKVMTPASIPKEVLVWRGNTFVSSIRVDGTSESAEWHTADSDGAPLSLTIAVPSLFWTVLLGTADRGAVGQAHLRLTAKDILDESTALLVVRTRKPAVWVGLSLLAGTSTLQREEGRASGAEGRWTFDLRRFGDTIRTADRPRLELFVEVDGASVPVGEVRSELGVSSVTTHVRMIPPAVYVAIAFESRRTFPNRVARLWSLSMPWRDPVVEPVVADRCDVDICRSEDDLPPGAYLAEIAVDDGWLAPARPVPGGEGVAELRIGTGWEEREWLLTRSAHPEIVLAAAYVCGNVLRPLEPSEVEEIAPSAITALATGHALGLNAATMERAVEAVGRVTCGHPGALTRGIITAVAMGKAEPGAPLLTVALDLLPRLARNGRICEDDGGLDRLWGLCEPLAAMLDAPRSENEAIRERLESYSGIVLSDLDSCRSIPEADDLRMMLQLPVEQLEAIRRQSGLLPRRVLDLETMAGAHLEWLVADRREMFASRWVDRHRELIERMPILPAAAAARLSEQRVPAKWRSTPQMIFPEIVYVAALHVATGSSRAPLAAAALQKIVGIAPALVRRSLVLAILNTRVLEAAGSQSEGSIA